jgi:hypothetical protein
VDTTTPGEPATGNVLDNVTSPPGTTETVTGFSVPGSDTVYPAGSTVPVTDPATGLVTGTMQVNPDGTYVFNPAPGYTGPVPPVTVEVTSSDGQTVEVPLIVTVNALLTDASESVTVTAGSGPVKVNVLDNTEEPAGTTATVTSFTLPGSAVVYPAGPTPVTVTDPVTGKVTGTVVVQPNADVTFTPAPGFTGQAPAITYTVESSDGQVSPGALTVTVLPGAQARHAVVHALRSSKVRLCVPVCLHLLIPPHTGCLPIKVHACVPVTAWPMQLACPLLPFTPTLRTRPRRPWTSRSAATCSATPTSPPAPPPR